MFVHKNQILLESYLRVQLSHVICHGSNQYFFYVFWGPGSPRVFLFPQIPQFYHFSGFICTYHSQYTSWHIVTRILPIGVEKGSYLFKWLWVQLTTRPWRMATAVGDPSYTIMEVQRSFSDLGHAEPSCKTFCQRAHIKQLQKIAVSSQLIVFLLLSSSVMWLLRRSKS